MKMYNSQRHAREVIAQIQKMRDDLKGLREKAGQGAVADAINALDQKVGAIAGAGGGGGRAGGGGGRGQRQAGGPTLASVSGEMVQLLEMLQGADATPTTQLIAAVGEADKAFTSLMGQWNQIKSSDLKALNDQLKAANLSTITIGS